MDELLKVEKLSVSFETDAGVLPAVDDVSFHIQKGEVLGLVGESGCGKTVASMSLLRLISQPPGKIAAQSRVIFAERDLLQLPTARLREVRGNEIGVIFQEPMTALSPLHRIGAQMVEALRLHRTISHQEARNVATEWLHKVGIPDAAERMYAYPFQFSGGMRQRAMIAAVLMLQPQLIIADEPTTALDVTIQAQVFELMVKMKETETSVLLITHDMGVIWELSDRVLVMYASQLVEEAPVKDLFERPLHPYTQGLLAAVPKLTGSAASLEAIEGQVPSPLDYPPYCHFCDRCNYAFDRCRKKMPQLIDLPNGRRIRCFKVEEDLSEGKRK